MVRPPMAGKGPAAVLRTVTSHLSLDVRTPLEILLSIAVADGSYDRSEMLSVRHEDGPLDVAEIKMAHGGRMHRVLAPAGRLVVDYQATVTGLSDLPAVEGPELVDAVVAWVTGHVTYLSGSSLPTDGATDTLLKRRGVCRDFAHLVVALLRAKDVPARLVSVYAPGLKPMDFH